MDMWCKPYFKELKITMSEPKMDVWRGLRAMLVILGVKKLDWMQCKRELKSEDLMVRMAAMNKEKAMQIYEELKPMMEEHRPSMDAEKMAIANH